MNPLLRLHSMLSEYQHVFKYSANFNHFCTYVNGLISTSHRGTMTQNFSAGNDRIQNSKKNLMFCLHSNDE